MRTTLTILLTSLVWAIIILCFFEPKRSEEATAPVVETLEVVTPSPTKSQKRSERKSQRTESSAEKQVSKSAPAEAAKTSTEASKPATTESTKATATESTTAAEAVKSTTETTKSATTTSTTTAETIDYAREIVGQWSPIEGSECPLEISKYGCAIQTKYGVKMRYTYSIKGKRINIGYDNNARFEITKENGVVYLELFNTTDFSGKYKRTSQPRKIAMRPLDVSTYAENIVGKWKPLDGQECNLELSKYGAAIQTKYGVDMRYDYTLNGKKLSIGYNDNASVVISEDASYYYLEIYNSEDFSGRYRKSK